MTVKPHKKLVNNKENKNSVGDKTCHTQRNYTQRQIRIQEIFLLDKALNSGSERLYKMVFFKIVKLIDNSTRKYGKNGTKNNPMNFKIEYKISERFFLIKQEKCRNI